MDYRWNADPRTWQALQGLNGIEQAYKRDGKLVAAYGVDGKPAATYESVAMYAGSLGRLMFSYDPTLPRQIYTQQLQAKLTTRAGEAYWGDPNNYYDQNIAWFATALLNNQFPNLAGEK